MNTSRTENVGNIKVVKVVIVGLSRLSVRAIDQIIKLNSASDPHRPHYYDVTFIMKEGDDKNALWGTLGEWKESKQIEVVAQTGELKTIIDGRKLGDGDCILALANDDLANIAVYSAMDSDSQAGSRNKNKPLVIIRCFDTGLLDRMVGDSRWIQRMYSLSALASIDFVAALCGVRVLTTLTMAEEQIAIYELEVKPDSPLIGLNGRQVKEVFDCAVIARRTAKGDIYKPEIKDSENEPIKGGNMIIVGGPPHGALHLMCLQEDHLPWYQWLRGNSLKKLLPTKLSYLKRQICSSFRKHKAEKDGAASSKRPQSGLDSSMAGKPKSWWTSRVQLSILVTVPVIWLIASMIYFTHTSLTICGVSNGVSVCVSKKLSIWQSIYFVLTTATTTGYGDVGLLDQGLIKKLMGISDMLVGVTLSGVAIALLSARLVADRSEESMLRRAKRSRRHFIVVGLGSLGYRVTQRLCKIGLRVVVIESNRDSPRVMDARALGALVIFGDARLPVTLEQAGVKDARGLLALTNDHEANERICRYVKLVSRSRKQPQKLVARREDGDEAQKSERESITTLSASACGLQPFIDALSPDKFMQPGRSTWIKRRFKLDKGVSTKNNDYLAVRYTLGKPMGKTEIDNIFRERGIRVLAFLRKDKNDALQDVLQPPSALKNLVEGDQMIICGPEESVNEVLKAEDREKAEDNSVSV